MKPLNEHEKSEDADLEEDPLDEAKSIAATEELFRELGLHDEEEEDEEEIPGLEFSPEELEQGRRIALSAAYTELLKHANVPYDGQSLGSWLQAVRTCQGFTIEEVAGLFGLSTAEWGNIEAGKTKVSALPTDTFVAILEGFNLPLPNAKSMICFGLEQERRAAERRQDASHVVSLKRLAQNIKRETHWYRREADPLRTKSLKMCAVRRARNSAAHSINGSCCPALESDPPHFEFMKRVEKFLGVRMPELLRPRPYYVLTETKQPWVSRRN